MAIADTDIKIYLTGAASEGGAQSDATLSLGGYRSSTEITSDVSGNLFDTVTGAEATAGDTEYRCVAVRNEHGSLDYTTVVVSLSDYTITSGGGGSANTISFAVETPETAKLTAANNAISQTVANESTAPTSINTTDHNGTGSGVSNWTTTTGTVTLDLGAHDADLGVDEVIFIWFKRVIGSSAGAATGVNFTPKLLGDTAA